VTIAVGRRVTAPCESTLQAAPRARASGGSADIRGFGAHVLHDIATMIGRRRLPDLLVVVV
jgi:hypothetical protein